jgi:hypothetical protein
MKRAILGILFGILWAGVFYALAYPLIFVAVASWAGAFCRCPRWRPIFVQSMIAAVLLVTVFLSASWLPFKLTPLAVKVLYVLMAFWSFWIARRGLTMFGRSESHRVMVQST